MKTTKLPILAYALAGCLHQPHTELDSVHGIESTDIKKTVEIVHRLIEKNKWRPIKHNSEMTYMNTLVTQFDMMNGYTSKPTLRLSGFVSKDFSESPLCNLLMEEVRFDGQNTISRVEAQVLKVSVPDINGNTYTDTVLNRPEEKGAYEFCSQWWEDLNISVVEIDKKIEEGYACEEIKTDGIEMSGFSGTDFVDLAIFPPRITGADAWSFGLINNNLQCVPIAGDMKCLNSSMQIKNFGSVLNPETKFLTAQIAVECAEVKKIIDSL